MGETALVKLSEEEDEAKGFYYLLYLGEPAANLELLLLLLLRYSWTIFLISPVNWSNIVVFSLLAPPYLDYP